MRNFDFRKFIRIILIIMPILILAACKSTTPTTVLPQPSETQQPQSSKVAQIQPGEPPAPELEFKDTSYTLSKADKGAKEGDLYNSNLFERPFSTDMTYLPDVDIRKAAFANDGNFFYFTITLGGTNTQTNDLQGLYAVELDTNLDGRGDYYIGALNPKGNTWTTADVSVRFDTNKDVGGPDPIKSDAPYAGNGYETTIANDQPEAAWVRVSPKDPSVVQIAVHHKLVGSPNKMLWGVTADNGIKDPGKYDYDDTYTQEQAGSPYVEEPTLYPLKIVNSFDNVCRQPFGFIPTVRIANMCYTAPTVPQPKVQGPTPTATPIPPPR